MRPVAAKPMSTSKACQRMKWLLNISTLEAADGGPPNAVLRIAIELAGRGDSVTVAYLERDGQQQADALKDARDAGVALHAIQVRKLSRFRLSLRRVAAVWMLTAPIVVSL